MCEAGKEEAQAITTPDRELFCGFGRPSAGKGNEEAAPPLAVHLILQEDRSCILKISLEKLRYLEDPEAYLRRSVLINNLLRKIHHEEEEKKQGGGARPPAGRRLLYPDRKRVKVVVADCCSPPFGLEEIPHYHLVPYPSSTCLYSLGTCPSITPNHGHQVLIYKLDDNG